MVVIFGGLDVNLLCVVCFSINDNEGVAEMLIESMGTNIINTSDSKGRWEELSPRLGSLVF